MAFHTLMFSPGQGITLKNDDCCGRSVYAAIMLSGYNTAFGINLFRCKMMVREATESSYLTRADRSARS